MKLEDIKSAVCNAALGELKRAIYNACAVCSESVIRNLIETEITEVFSSSSSDKTRKN